MIFKQSTSVDQSAIAIGWLIDRRLLPALPPPLVIGWLVLFLAIGFPLRWTALAVCDSDLWLGASSPPLLPLRR